ncbi:unnamed protein product [Lathyrus sativus]|nr:unnamed protein product [Lathyrus sativus]
MDKPSRDDHWIILLRMNMTPQANLCLISDRHPSIKSVYDDPENGWQYLPSSHVYEAMFGQKCWRLVNLSWITVIREWLKKRVNLADIMSSNLIARYSILWWPKELIRKMADHWVLSTLISTCTSIRQDHTMYIPDVFKIFSVFKIYKESFFELPHHENWQTYEGYTLFHDETMRRKKKGCPNSTQIRTKMDDVEKEKRKCVICHKICHMRRKCPNIAGPSR